MLYTKNWLMCDSHVARKGFSWDFKTQTQAILGFIIK